MLIKTPISLAELLDKISILILKEKNIKDENKLILIRKELKYLNAVLDKNISKNKIHNYLESLLEVNTKLWNIEDDIRNCEKNKQFDQKFIDLARSVYFTNDKRSEIKLKINKEFGSEIVEVKSYEEY
ncbi:MAG: hypothetical protein CFH15_00908 [Alphaproteobacteria bacterium MarineAlpha5_Bin5]|nr:MAG: hypothetical protein CFH15_00908 [Alphaproteobacteria bacterium MarineAlpha5_Bin5]PPR52278.1 MAG: hypothetical protein CFH14_00475 [Alphaproteobacteria bacterium MarineAlpha5_Bin4]|tara:strand:- start:2858 stop:3241 length:384 start_codon:yes stop_codon:yes gene_type:complete